MSDMNETVLAKVKKLFALSNSPNENEAALALEKAHALLKEYNLSMSDISPDSKYGIMEEEFLTGVNESKWKTLIIMGVTEANYCTVIKNNRYSGFTYMIVGKPHNIAVAKEMATYLIDTVDRLAKRFPANQRVSYKNGASYTLYKRLQDSLKKDTEECTALVVQEKSMIKDFLSDKNLKTKDITISSKSSTAYYKGTLDANNISLNSQIGGSSKPTYIGA